MPFRTSQVENPTKKANRLKARLRGISLSEYGSEGSRVRWRRLSEYGSVACFVERLKVARLQSEFCTKDFFRATNFLTKNAPKFSPKLLSLCSVGQKNPGKFPPNSPLNFPNFPVKNQNKITDELLQDREKKDQHGKHGPNSTRTPS